jgi:hypothetical protein
MKLSKMTFVTAAVIVFSCAAMAEGVGVRRDLVFSSDMIGSMPNQTVAGISSGNAPWTIREGHASLRRNGKLNVEVEGLLITAGTLANGNPVPDNLVGTVGPVSMVAASLVCGGVIVGSTPVVPLTPAGDAEMEGKIKGSNFCATPVVLVRIAPSVSATTAELGAFIALSGSAMSDDNPNDDANDDRGGDRKDDRGHDGPQHHPGDDHGGR